MNEEQGKELIESYKRNIEMEESKLRAAIARASIAAEIMTVCQSYVPYKNKKSQGRIYSRVHNMTKGIKTSKKKILQERIKKELSQISDIEVKVSTSQIEENLKQKLQRFKIPNYQIEQIAYDIKSNPIGAIEEYMQKYINAYQDIDYIRKEIEELERKIQEVSKNIKKQKNPEPEDVKNKKYSVLEEPYQPQPYHRYAEVEETPVREIPFDASEKEKRKEKIKETIRARVKDKKSVKKFEYEEKQEIKKVYPELNNVSTEYLNVDVLNKGMIVENIINNKKVDVDSYIEMVLYTYEIMVKEILSKPNRQNCELYTELDIENAFEKYEKYYKIFEKYYNSLSEEQKEEFQYELSSVSRYSSNFGKEIVTPEKLKRKVNREIISEVANDQHKYLSGHEEDLANLDNQILNVDCYTKYMSIEEIITFYEKVKQVNRRYWDENIDEAQKNRRLRNASHKQIAFASAILDKFERYSGNNKSTKLTEQEEKEKLAAICMGCFNENPLDSNLQAAIKNNSREKGKELEKEGKIKEEAISRVYGMPKVKRALSKLTGKWQKYMMLMGKEELTAKEEETLSGMFK